MEKHIEGTDISKKLSQVEVEYEGDMSNLSLMQRLLLKRVAAALIVNPLQKGKWAVVAMGKVSFYETQKEAETICAQLPVVGSIIPPPDAEYQPEPGWEIATIVKSEPRGDQPNK